MVFLLTFSCERKELPFEQFDELTKGAFPRLLESSGDWFLTDVANSVFSFHVEFYDENQGRNVESYSIGISFRDNDGEDPNNSVSEKLWKTFNASDFGTSSSGLPDLSTTVSLQEAMDHLGLTLDMLNGGDDFFLWFTLRKTDGQEFRVENTGSNIISSAAFNGFFTKTLSLKCTSDLAGTFNYESTALTTPNGPCDPTTATGTVTWTATASTGVYEMDDASFGNFGVCYGGPPATGVMVTDVCNRIGTDGGDQYGDTYDYSVTSVDGNKLTMDWTNTFGDGGTVVLTRTDGRDWPDLK